MSASPASNPQPRGNWIVLALLAIGLLAAIAAVWHWRNLGRLERQAREARLGGVSGDPVQDTDALQSAYADFRDRGQLQGMVGKARELAARYPEHAPAQVLLGQLLLDTRDSAAAQQALEAAIALDPRDAEVHLLAGHAALLNEDLASAERHFSQAMGIHPNVGRYRLHMADVQLRKGELDAARRLLLEALNLDSSLHAAYSGLSDLYARQNKLDLALQQIQKALDRVSDVDSATRRDYVIYTRKKANLLRRDNRPSDALATLETLTAKERIDPEVMEEQALCWAMMGQPDMAAKLYEQAKIVLPLEPRIVAGAAKWQFQAGNREAAERHLRDLKKIDPRLPETGEIEKLLGAKRE